MYSYKEQRKEIFTESGVSMLLKMRDNINKKLDVAGAVCAGKAMENISGDTWVMLAILDYLIEINELVEVTQEMECRGQDKIFTRKCL